jgi:hypothetical protein
VPVYKELGEAIAKDSSLKNRVVIAKVGIREKGLLVLFIFSAMLCLSLSLCHAAPVSLSIHTTGRSAVRAVFRVRF